MPLPDDDDDVVTRPNFALVINAFVLSPMSSSSSSSIRSTTTTSTVYVLLHHIREREREAKQFPLLYIVLVKSS